MKETLLIAMDPGGDHLKNLSEEFPELSIVAASSPEEILHHLPEAGIFISFTCPANYLEAGKRLRWVQLLRSGTDGSALQEMHARKILVTTARGIHKEIMAQYALAAMIMTCRSWPEMLYNQQKKIWNHGAFQGSIRGKTLGILGYGIVGREVARLARETGMEILALSRKKKENCPDPGVRFTGEVRDIFRHSDYVLNLLPLTPETRGLIGRELLEEMQTESVFMNLGRGATVVESDLADVLENGRIRGAVLDVFEQEPLPEDHRFWELPNVILTPHVSGSSSDYFGLARDLLRSNIRLFLEGKTGEMKNRILPDMGGENPYR